MSLICIADRQVGGLGRSSPLLFFVCFWLTRPPRLRDDARSARHLGSEAAIPAIQTEWYWRIPAVSHATSRRLSLRPELMWVKNSPEPVGEDNHSRQVRAGSCRTVNELFFRERKLEVSQPGRPTTNDSNPPPSATDAVPHRPAWNQGKLTGPKPPLRTRVVHATWRCSILPSTANCAAATSSCSASMTWRRTAMTAMRSTALVFASARQVGPPDSS